MTTILSIISSVVLVGITLLAGLIKDWRDWPRWARGTVLILILIVGAAGVLMAIYANREAKQRDQKIVRLTQAFQTEQANHQRNIARFQEQFDRLNEDIGELKSKVRTQELEQQLEETRAELRATQEALAPGPKAKLAFSFFATDLKFSAPQRETSIPAQDDRVTFEFVVINPTDVDALNGELWLYICDDCRFGREPQGLTRLDGMAETIRYRRFTLHGRTTMRKTSVEIVVPERARYINVGFNYRCRACEIPDKIQKARVNILR